MVDRLAGKVVVVTGSTRGVGRGIAGAVAGQGAATVVTGRNRERGEAVASAIVSAGGEALFLAADLTREEEVEALAEHTCRHYGHLDGLVNNAAAVDQLGNWEGPITEVSLANWNHSLSSNLTSVFLASKHCIRAMVHGGTGGSVVNIASIAGVRGMQGVTGYAAAKGGVIALTKSVAAYYSRYDVRCNTLTFGSFPPEGPPNPQRANNLDCGGLERYQSGLSGEPADAAWAAIYLLSDESRFVTAANINLDGGWAELAHAPNPLRGRDLDGHPRTRLLAPEC